MKVFRKNQSKSVFAILAFVSFTCLGLFSCEEHVTPDKVERKITNDSWQITSFSYADTNVVTDYVNKLFGFGESGNIIIQLEPSNTGGWSVGLNKKPTVMYINGFANVPYTRLNDDWEVTAVSGSILKLSSENGAYTNKVTFAKVEQD